MKRRIIAVILIVVSAAVLLFTACGGGSIKGKSFEIAGTNVTMDKTAQFLDITYPYSSEFVFTNTGSQRLVYDLKDTNGGMIYGLEIKYGFMNFGNNKVLEDDISSFENDSSVSGFSKEEKSIGKKTWTVLSFSKYDEDFGKKIAYHVCYTVHTHISETGFYRFIFKNADGAAEFENSFMKAVKFN